MDKKRIAAAFTLSGLVILAGCTSYPKPPVAVSRSAFTSIPGAEHQKLDITQKLLTLEDAQNLAVQNNPDFKTKYFAVVGARGILCGVCSLHAHHYRRLFDSAELQ